MDSTEQDQGGSAGDAVALEGYTAAGPGEVPLQVRPGTACRGCAPAGHHKPHEAEEQCKGDKLKNLGKSSKLTY